MRHKIFLAAVTVLMFLSQAMMAQSTYTVTNTNDAGAGSLRQAIIDANSNVDLSNINFNITGTGPFNIVLNSQLPSFTTRISLNGFTQSGASTSNYKIKTSSSSPAPNSYAFILNSGSANSVIEGIEISNFGTGIQINATSVVIKNNLISSSVGFIGIWVNSASNATVTGNKIGINVTGLTPVGIMDIGIYVLSSSGTIIGGPNLSDKNHVVTNKTCIQLTRSTNCIIKGNLVGGLDKNENLLSETYWPSIGIYIHTSSSNIIGGTTNEGNIIGGTKNGPSENHASGIFLVGFSGEPATSNNIILGNRIGINSIDNIISNQLYGIQLSGSSNNTIGSSNNAEANIISGNYYGIYSQLGASNNLIKGNKIGVNSLGTVAKPNSAGGIFIDGNFSIGSNTIGGNTSQEGNLISGNGIGGILISKSSQNVIKNNFIGVNYNGTQALPNTSGIVFLDQIASGTSINQKGGSNNNIIGSDISNGNLISGNSTYGIQFKNNNPGNNIYSFDNQIKGNKIGVDINGNALPNLYDGILINNTGTNHSIGGLTLQEKNIIAYNGGNGISITSGYSNPILSNYIYNNGTKAINLNSIGNINKSSPLIISAVINGSNMLITGTTSSSSDKIQFFLGDGASQNANIYISGSDFTTVGTSWSTTIPVSSISSYLTSFPKILATATDINNNTSELSNVLTIINCDQPIIFSSLPDQYCLNATPLTLSATPSGGTFSGTGVSGTTFTPSTVGANVISYTITIAGCSTKTTSKTINVEDYSNITVNQSCSYEPGLKRRWYIDHPTHTNPITLTYTVTNPVDATTKTGNITTNSSGRTYFETETSGTAFVGLYDFSASGDAVLSGYTLDRGEAYNAPSKTFGWDVDNQSNILTSALTMWDSRYAKSINTRNAGVIRSWKVDVPNGDYEVKLVCGHQTTGGTPSKNNSVTIEGNAITDALTNNDWDEYIVRVTVSDGQLNIVPATASSNMGFAFVDIRRIVINTIVVKACNVNVATATNTGTRCSFNGPATVCPSSSSNYDVSIPTPSVVGSTFAWSMSPAGAATITGTTNASVLASNTQTGPVTITVTESNPNYVGGISSISRNIYIQPVGQPSFTPFDKCIPTSDSKAKFPNTSTTVSSFTNSYIWYVDNVQFSTSASQGEFTFNNNPAVPTSLYGPHDIKLQVTVRGCSTQYTLNYVAAPTPAPSFTISDANQAVCDGTEVTFTNTTSITNLFPLPGSNPPKTMDGAWLYEWNFNDGSALDNKQTPTPHIYTNTATTNIIRNASLVVRGNNFGCSATYNLPITTYGKPLISLQSLSSYGVGCPGNYDGNGMFYFSGGTAPYNYTFKEVTTGLTITSGNSVASGSYYVGSLGMGTYIMELTDKSNLAATEQCPAIPQSLTIGLDGPDISVCTQLRTCVAGSLGSIQIKSSTDANSGRKSGWYAYTLTNKFTQQTWTENTIPFNVFSPSFGPNSRTISNLPDGSYTMVVTTNNSPACVYTFELELGPPILTPGIQFTPICNGSVAPATVIFNSSLYRGSCTPSATNYSAEVRNATNQVMPPPNSLIYALPAGVYTYILSESNSSCTISGSFDVNKGVPFTVNVQNVKNAKCFNTNDGSATVLVNGISNVSYTWINTADPLNPLLIQGQNATGLTPGTYFVKVTDNASGCEMTSSNFTIQNANEIEIQSVDHVLPLGTCQSTAVMVSGKSGTYPITYAWIKDMPNNQQDTRYVSPPVSASSHTGVNITPGTYQVIVTDANGCKSPPKEYNHPGLKREYEICIRYINIPRVKDPTEEPPIANEIEVETVDLARALQEKTQQCLSALQNEGDVKIKETCEDPKNLKDQLKLSYKLTQYHYTLYKYNRAGDLTATIPPNAVANIVEQGTIPSNRTNADASTLSEYKDYQTSYRYNTLGQLSFQNTPDAGNSMFYYDDKGLLRFSRNARQLAASGNGLYSYTKYDALGRIIEIGENSDWTSANASLTNNLNNYSYPATGTERTFTYYSLAGANLTSYPFAGTNLGTQRYQRNRISRMTRENVTSNGTISTNIYYSYDPHGNVEWLRQDNPNLYNSYIAYEYDLISNKVIKVRLNEGYRDRMFHRYSYDTDNRLTEVYTSRNNITWEKDANYNYYLHGPLQRTVLGQDKVQGVDYTYTIQGWLKGINSPDLVSSKDPGGDIGGNTPTDAFGMALTYFKGDFDNNYDIVNGNVFNSSSSVTNNPMKLDPSQERFNGNITGWSMMASNLSNSSTNKMGNLYTYDRLNRILSSSFVSNNGFAWNAQNGNDYATTYSYDPNGNIKSLSRQGYLTGSPASNKMDNLNYYYEDAGHNYTAINRLKRVNESGDHTNQSTLGWGDIDASGNTKVNANNANYVYDETGNLVLDLRQQIKISWDVYGKVKQIDPTNTSGTVITPTAAAPRMIFEYDPLGNRTTKQKITNAVASTTWDYYYNDAAGNMMEVFRVQPQMGNPLISVSEMGIYGSDRLGEYKPTTTDIPLEITVPSSRNIPNLDETSIVRKIGFKQYELTDHLRNITSTISDRVIRTGAFRTAEVYTYATYYPFGMVMPGKTFVTAGYNYRYGYQGEFAEKDPEYGFNSFKLRMYSSTLARWISVDPYKQYPSPYCSMGNDPINGIDPDGGRKNYYNEDGTYSHTTHDNWFHNTLFGTKSFVQNGDDYVGFSKETHSKWVNNPGEGSFKDYVLLRNAALEWVEESERISNLESIGFKYDPNMTVDEARKNLINDFLFVAQPNRYNVGGYNKNNVVNNNGWMDGSSVYGHDAATLSNAEKMIPEEGLHQVLLHGTPDGFYINGSYTTPKELARFLLSSGYEKGKPIRLVSCHTGVAGDGAAYQLSRYLKVPVTAPTNKIRVLEGGSYEIFGEGRFRTFYNTTIIKN